MRPTRVHRPLFVTGFLLAVPLLTGCSVGKIFIGDDTPDAGGGPSGTTSSGTTSSGATSSGATSSGATFASATSSGATSSGTTSSSGGTGGTYPPGTVCPTISTQLNTLNPCGHAAGLAYSPDGTLLAVANMDSSPALMWRLSDGALVKTFDGMPTNYDVAFSPDGKTLALVGGAQGSNASAKIFDVATGDLIRTLPTNSGFYTDTVAFSPDGTYIATSGYMGAIDLWRASDGSLVVSIPYPTSVHNVHFSPSGTLLIAGGVDQRATIYNVPSGTLAMTLNGIADEMADATFSPDGTQIATTSSDGNGVKVWDAATGALLQTMSGHAAYVSSVVWISNNVLVSGDWQGNVIVWTRVSGTPFARYNGWNTGGQVLGIAVSPNKMQIATGAGTPQGFEFFEPVIPGGP
jgi:WD40 repeat protein